MKIHFPYVLFAIFFFPAFTFAAPFSGSGTGENQDDACYYASTDLVTQAYRAGMPSDHGFPSYSFTKLARRAINDRHFYSCEIGIETDVMSAPKIEQMIFTRPIETYAESGKFQYSETSAVARAITECATASGQTGSSGEFRYYRPLHSAFTNGTLSGGNSTLERQVTCALYAVDFYVPSEGKGASKEAACAAAGTSARDKTAEKCGFDALIALDDVALSGTDSDFDQASGVWTCRGTAAVSCRVRK